MQNLNKNDAVVFLLQDLYCILRCWYCYCLPGTSTLYFS